MYIGTTEIAKMLLGSTEIGKAYLGSTLVYGGGDTPTPPTPVLPEGYTQLTYIEQPLGNSAYIKTGVIADNTIGYEIDAQSYDQLSKNTGDYGCIMGGRIASGQNDFQITTYSLDSNYAGTVRLGWTNTYSARLTYNTRFSATLSGTTYSIGGNDTTVVRNLSTNTRKEIYVFALNNNGEAVQFGHLKLYSLIITDNGTEVRHYIPCKNPQNVIGLYDTINESFVTSANNTAFSGE